MMKKITAICALCATMMLCACQDGGNDEKAMALLAQATGHLEKKQYAECLQLIDSLRKTYPKAIAARKEALALYQQAQLQRAQQHVALTDGALQDAERRYQAMRHQVEALKATGEATAAQLTQLTRMRMLRDSLQTVFDVECAKIRYIKKKMQ